MGSQKHSLQEKGRLNLKTKQCSLICLDIIWVVLGLMDTSKIFMKLLKIVLVVLHD